MPTCTRLLPGTYINKTPTHIEQIVGGRQYISISLSFSWFRSTTEGTICQFGSTASNPFLPNHPLYLSLHRWHCVAYLIQVLKVHLGAIVGPWAKFHEANLLVVRKILDIHFTWWLVNCRWLPENFPCILQGGLCHQRDLQRRCYYESALELDLMRPDLVVSIPVIIEHNVGNPNVFRRHIQLFYASVFFGIPTKLVIKPPL